MKWNESESCRAPKTEHCTWSGGGGRGYMKCDLGKMREGERIWEACVVNWLWRWLSEVKRCIVTDIPNSECTDWIIGWLDLANITLMVCKNEMVNRVKELRPYEVRSTERHKILFKKKCHLYIHSRKEYLPLIKSVAIWWMRKKSFKGLKLTTTENGAIQEWVFEI